MSSAESIREHVEHGFLSIRRSVKPKDEKAAPNNRGAILTALESAEPNPSSPDFIEIALNLIQPEIDQMLTEGVSPEETARKATRAADAFLRAMGKGNK